MGDLYLNREAEMTKRFTQQPQAAQPIELESLLGQNANPVQLSGNMYFFENHLWDEWTDQKIQAKKGELYTVRDAQNRLNIILRDPSNRFWVSSEQKDLLWSNWFTPYNLSHRQNEGMTRRFTVGRFGRDGQVVLFVHGIDGHIWDYWSSPETIETQPWVFNKLPMCTDSEFFALERAYGGLETFAIGLDGGVWHSWTKDYDHDEWSQWESLGGCAASGLYLANNSELYPELLVCDPQGSLWTIRHYTKDGWKEWIHLGNNFRGSCACVINAGGGMNVYGVGFDRKLYRITRPTLNAEWAGWECLGGMFDSLVGAVVEPTGAEKVCMIGADRQLWRLNAHGTFDNLGGELDFARIDVDENGCAVVVVGCSDSGNVFCRRV